MRRGNFMAFASLMLAGCGGGGATGTSVVTAPSTPTPPATPTPTPSPTPTASYTLFDNLAGDQTFQSACAPLTFQTTPPTPSPATPFGQGLVIAYQAATQNYMITGDGQSLSFGPADVDSAAPPTVKAYLKAGVGGNDRFVLSQPGPGGVGLGYARSATVATRRFGFPISYYCVIGVPTLVSDVPSATTINFTKTILGATAYDSSSGTVVTYGLSHSTVSFVVDLSTLQVTSTLHLLGTPVPAGGADVDLGTVTGTGTIDASVGGFYGSWSSADREAIGNFGGRFFGPQGLEYGYAFNFVGRNSSANLVFTAGGTSFGSR
jgi:hypothetical protein